MIRPVVYVTIWTLVFASGFGAAQDRAKPETSPADVVVPQGVIPDRIASGLVKGPVYRFAVHNVAYRPDGVLLAGGSGDGFVFLWDLRKKKRGVELAPKVKAHKDWAFSVVWTANGRQFISGGGDNLIHLYDLAQVHQWYKESKIAGFKFADAAYEGKPIRTFQGHTMDVHAIALTNDEQTLVSAGDDRTVIVWDFQTAQIRRRLIGHEKQIPTLAISPDESLIATGSRDRTIRLWELSSGKSLKTLAGHQGDVMAVRFSPGGQRLASASYDKTVRIWEVETGKELAKLQGHSDWVYSVNFSPDGKHLASAGDNTVRLWDASSGKPIWTSELTGQIQTATESVREHAAFVAFAPDGEELCVSSTAGTVTIMNVADGSSVRRILAWSKRSE